MLRNGERTLTSLLIILILALTALACGNGANRETNQTDTTPPPTPAPTEIVANLEAAPTQEPTTPPDDPTATATEVALTSEPEATTEPTAAPAPTDTPQASKALVTAGATNVNIRSGPGTNYETIGQLITGESLEIIGRNPDSSWWQVATANGLGWIAAGVTTATGVDDSIQIAEASPPPVQEQPASEQAAAQTSEPQQTPGLQEAQVINIVDGDTIDVLINGAEYRVRYILVDTPESTTSIEPFGPEATEANRQLVEGKTVQLEKDVSETDRYSRLLRYIYVDGLMVNEELLRQGVATVATFPPDVKYVDRFLVVQQEAQAAGVGIWSSQPVVEQPTPTPVPADQPPPAVQPSGSGVALINIFFDGVVSRVESDEYIEIANQGAEAVDVSSWKINAGDPGQDFIFPQGFVMQPGQTCRVYTNEHHSESCGLSFGSGKAIWANDGDIGTLYNGQGEVMSQKGY